MPRPSRIAPKVLRALTQPRPRPLVLRGRSGTGKTSLLRAAVERSGREVVWCSAFDLVLDMVQAMRNDRLAVYRAGLTEDPRPLCVEHLEDLGGRPATREELRLVLAQAAGSRPILLTLTRARGDAEVAAWLRPWTEIVSLGRSRIATGQQVEALAAAATSVAKARRGKAARGER